MKAYIRQNIQLHAYKKVTATHAFKNKQQTTEKCLRAMTYNLGIAASNLPILHMGASDTGL
jgi:hypothetical protein